MQEIQAIKTQEKDPLEIATTFNDYFSTVGQNLAAQITKDKQYVKPEIQEPNTSLEIPRVTPVIIGKYIDKLPNNKSSGFKDLPIKAVKAAKDSISICLSHIINNIFEQCKIPQNWKAAIITPIHKGGLKETVSNYQPISVLPFMDKLLERVIKDNLMTHLEGQKCLTENQGGYRKNYSTVTMTRKLVDHILNNREDKIPTVAVFIDLSKAFDTISHKGLITKLQKYGIKNDVLNLLKDYLSHRTQQTSINGTLSQPREINYGVPQGSVLGPIFFLLFINDMEKVIKHSQICLFADDTVLYNSNINKETMELELQEDLTSLSRWLNNNELTINVKKSKEIRNNIHINTAVTIFKSVIQPHLDYCNIVWDAAGQSLKGKLQEIQEKALEIAYQGVKVNDTNTLHRLSKTLPINERTEMHLAQHVYNITKLPSPVFLKSTISYTSHTYHTRGKEDKNLKLRKPRTESLRKTVYYRSS